MIPTYILTGIHHLITFNSFGAINIIQCCKMERHMHPARAYACMHVCRHGNAMPLSSRPKLSLSRSAVTVTEWHQHFPISSSEYSDGSVQIRLHTRPARSSQAAVSVTFTVVGLIWHASSSNNRENNRRTAGEICWELCGSDFRGGVKS